MEKITWFPAGEAEKRLLSAIFGEGDENKGE